MAPRPFKPERSGMPAGELGAITLWTLDLDGVESAPGHWLAVLDDAERRQYARFVRGEDRTAYAAAHALLRNALSLQAGAHPAELRFVRDGAGKPRLDAPAVEGIDFNLSHTTGMVSVAVSLAGPVGVDVERIDRKPFAEHDLSAFGLCGQEIEELASMPDPERQELFFDLWTAREAVSKADGRGLALPFSSILVDRRSNTASIHEPGAARPASRWNLWRCRHAGRHRLSVAWPQGPGRVQCNDAAAFGIMA